MAWLPVVERRHRSWPLSSEAGAGGKLTVKDEKKGGEIVTNLERLRSFIYLELMKWLHNRA